MEPEVTIEALAEERQGLIARMRQLALPAEPTEEQDAEYKSLRDEKIPAVEQQIKRLREIEEIEKRGNKPGRPPLRPETDPQINVGDDLRTKKPWESVGHQLRAVQRYATSRELDPRLMPETDEKRAASGLSGTVDSDGGFLLQDDFATGIMRDTYETGQILSRVRRFPISGRGIKFNSLDETSRADGSRWGGFQALWIDEGGSGTYTKPKLRQNRLEVHKLAGFLPVTEDLMEDAVALSAFVGEMAPEEFSFVIERAIFRGDGAAKPLGITQSQALVSVAKEAGQAGQTIVPENIAKMRSRLKPGGRSSSVWLINQDAEPQLHLMVKVVGTGGVPVYLPANGLSGTPFDTLYGRPVIPIEHASTVGTVGDIVYCDLSKYAYIDKGEMQTAVSIHVLFLTGEDVFRFTMRVDGQPMETAAVTPAQGSNTQSSFVALATRA